ncbi:EAL domain-containing protein [Mesobacillus selenatarsenatis]|uniref:EAL domain-containing protein n=1 Tax=Mesobacillus selenatarsenatis TaxID=388741 RepID=A0A846TI32_9BACI|nr:EAL domain-containing protein [Mesobacillus selenatarsenatis]NKE05714.1 EAL domain-containing protein [Mesobacillus selenatarsenatis]
MATTKSCFYENEQQLNSFIEGNSFKDHHNLLVQIFYRHKEKQDLQHLERMLKKQLPASTVLSCEAVGCLTEEKKYIVTFTIIDKQELNPVLQDQYTINTLNNLVEVSQQDILNLNESLKVSEQYYRSLFDNNGDFVYSTDLTGNFTSINQAFMKTFGYTEDDLIGRSALDFIKEEDVHRAKMHFIQALKGKDQTYTIEIPIKSGEAQIFQIKNIPITVNGACVGTYGIGRNITTQKKSEEKIIQLAYYDQDTGLPNRMRFTEQLEEMLHRAKHRKEFLAVLVIDIDRFKIINDSLGHYAGDIVLKELAERILERLPAGAFFGRFSGDKFTLLLTENVSIDQTTRFARELQNIISMPLSYQSQEFIVTASIGISSFPGDGLDEQVLLKNADIAMNRSKNEGGNKITYFSTGMNDQAMVRLELESYLRKALQKNEFHLCYQPLMDLKSGEITCTEALIRWQHPHLGLVSPAQFIPLAEETGLIEEIGAWVLTTACVQTKAWQQNGFPNLGISVNVSAYQFQHHAFIGHVIEALEISQLGPGYLSLELTESAMLEDIVYSISVMKSLQELGVKVSIDDFGTGYSSLSYLRNLPIDTLKIDQSFINNLHDDPSDIAIVKAIITMGQGLSVKIVAEGVETHEQLNLLRELDCHYAQGFYIEKPLDIAAFEKGFRTMEKVEYTVK